MQLATLDLPQRIAEIGAMPFQHQIVQSPWSEVRDIPELHQEVKTQLLQTVLGCTQKGDVARCITIAAPAGYGKTHLLAWLRRQLELNKDHPTLFVHVVPYLYDNNTVLDPNQHLLKCAIDSLRYHAPQQLERLRNAIRDRFVKQYEAVIAEGSYKKAKNLHVLQGSWANFWTWSFFPSQLAFSQLTAPKQNETLHRLLTRRNFLTEVFLSLRDEYDGKVEGVSLDWDTFVALCLLALGDKGQQWVAGEWFSVTSMPLQMLQAYHFDQKCQGQTKIVNALYTLQSLLQERICIAYDQAEELFTSFTHYHPSGTPFRFFEIVHSFYKMPGFAVVCMLQQSALDLANQLIPQNLRDRLYQGGLKRLQPLDAATAELVVRQLMAWEVWQPLGKSPPDADGLYPFDKLQIQEIRKGINSELRPFLKRMQEEFDRLLQSELQRKQKPQSQLLLLGIEPRSVISGEQTLVTIRGQHLPDAVQVLFDGIPLPPNAIVHYAPGEGILRLLPSPHLQVGEVEVRVEERGNPQNSDSLNLTVHADDLPRPFCQSMDAKKFRERRKYLMRLDPKFTQKWVAEQIGHNAYKLSQFETGKWNNAPDEIYEKLANLYSKPLSDFLRDSST